MRGNICATNATVKCGAKSPKLTPERKDVLESRESASMHQPAGSCFNGAGIAHSFDEMETLNRVATQPDKSWSVALNADSVEGRVCDKKCNKQLKLCF